MLIKTVAFLRKVLLMVIVKTGLVPVGRFEFHPKASLMGVFCLPTKRWFQESQKVLHVLGGAPG